MKRRVGLVMAYKGSNYGAQLQAYATQYVIESLGLDTTIIDFQRKKLSLSSILFGPGLLTYFFLSRRERRIRKKTRLNINNPSFVKNREERKKQLNSFIARRLRNIKTYYSYEALEQDALSFSAVLIGSDQKWLPGACYDKISSLFFAKSPCSRVSYATSLGVYEYPAFCKTMSRKMWQKFDYLSVREKTGASIIESICGDITVNIVVDPTYLLTNEKWLELIPYMQMIEGNYVLCYFLGDDSESKDCARRFCDKNGLKLVSIMSDESFSDIDLKYPDEIVTGASPEDFVNLIRGASYIFTDSFHGVAFSVINNKQFFVFYRKRDDATLSRNSRIDDILRMWGLQNRLITNKSIDWSLTTINSIDYKKVNDILIIERMRSSNFLKKALLNEDV